jgi:hypothetical protein
MRRFSKSLMQALRMEIDTVRRASWGLQVVVGRFKAHDLESKYSDVRTIRILHPHLLDPS